jgi:CrcB protein
MDYLIIGLGGALGALARYGLGRWVGRRWQSGWPLATFGINITGSFMLGFLAVVLAGPTAGYEQLRNFLTIGFLGGYTTYSTFSYEIIQLMTAGEKYTATGYFLASLLVGLAAAYGGVVLGCRL